MLFNVSQLLREHPGATRRFVLDAEGPIHKGTALLTRAPDGVLVQVKADVVFDTMCSRCLAPFGYETNIEFDEIYHQQVDVVSGRKLADPADPEVFLIDTHHIIDITEAVRQYSETAAEMQPLCRPDCPGICPVCGKDQNVTPCSCDRAPIDPRWATLAALN
jgi:uncharacterized protein